MAKGGGRPGKKSGRGGGGTGLQNNKNKKKKGKGPNNPKNKKGQGSSGQKSTTSNTSTAASGGSSSSRAAQMNNKKKQSSHAPPWKVVSKKDMAKNIKAEKQRRKLAQQGIHNHHNVDDDDDNKLGISKSFLSPEEKALLAWKRFTISPKDQIDFIGAYLNQQLPPRLGAPEVAFLGRSNVGKSSLLNRLVGSTKVARVGKTPGATASVNLYGIFRNEKALLGLVDLPGFGYAKLSKESKEAVQIAAERYLGKRQELALGIMLVDIRRKPSDDDRAVLAALYDMGVPIVVVATKVDKLSKNQLSDALQVIRDGLGLPEGQPLCVSSIDGTGIKDLWKIILEGCENAVEELCQKLQQSGNNDNSRTDNIDHDDEDSISFEEEGDEFVYSQGYDWIHQSSSVMYEGDEGEFYYDDEEFSPEDFEEVDDDQYSSSITAEENLPMRKETMKDLRKRAKDMELRGEL